MSKIPNIQFKKKIPIIMRLDSNIESKSSNNTLGLTFVCRVGMTSGCLCVTVMPTVYFIDIVSEGQIDALP